MQTAALAHHTVVSELIYAVWLMQIDAIAMNDNSDDGKPWVRSTDAVNLNLTQSSFTQASQAEPSSSQVLF